VVSAKAFGAIGLAAGLASTFAIEHGSGGKHVGAPLVDVGIGTAGAAAVTAGIAAHGATGPGIDRVSAGFEGAGKGIALGAGYLAGELAINALRLNREIQADGA
jgi:hypothetical protein